jgi:hypothetical protein
LEQVLFRDTLVEHRNRKEYFDPINFPEGSDLFLDPDTGVEPKSGPKKCHVGLNDLSKLLPDKSRRLIMVYQHRPRMDDSVQAVLDRIGQRRWIACAYWAGTVSMLFLSKQQDRIAGVYNTLAEWLGPCNEGEDGCPRRLFSKGMAE